MSRAGGVKGDHSYRQIKKRNQKILNRKGLSVIGFQLHRSYGLCYYRCTHGWSVSSQMKCMLLLLRGNRAEASCLSIRMRLRQVVTSLFVGCREAGV